ncbi:hypothetical protein [Streptomyces panaciradicis]|uniref:hypothetical protein n=1 Tax=Streptomyces panaciradicis TaxID=1470261 RepID=UPI00201CFDFC|nr:hypothetical protein [Streptomyces panaciradicis]MCL6672706.1 hypothetical protein [Streptomyces panaciradicis]
MELAAEQAAEQIETWLAAPGGPYETLAIRGLPGSGKAELLRVLAARNPRAVFVDCQGMTAEEIAHRLLAAWGVTESSGSLVSDAFRVGQNGIAFLGNVQWADRFVTSDEANEITHHVLRTLRRCAPHSQMCCRTIGRQTVGAGSGKKRSVAHLRTRG